MDEDGDRASVPLDRRGRTQRCRDGLVDGVAVGVDPPVPAVDPVDDLERRVVQGVGERVAQRHARIQGEQHAGCGCLVEATAEHSGQERERHGGEGDEEEHPHDGVGPVVEPVDRDRREEQRERDPARDEDRPQGAAAGDRGAVPPLNEDGGDGDQDDDHDDRRHRHGRVLQPGMLRHGDGARRALGAPLYRRLVDERRDRGRSEGREASDGEQRPVAPPQRPVGIGQDQGCERDEGEIPEDEPGRPDPGLVRLGQRREEPEVSGGGEQEADRVVGPPPEGHEPGDDEREAGGDGDGDGQPGVVVALVREDECDRDGRLDERRRPGEREA